MQLDIKAITTTCALLWGGATLLVGIANIAFPGYGLAFLDLLASVYPGYEVTATGGSVFVLTLYGIVDGALGGLVFAWLYNALRRSAAAVPSEPI
jgi:hypothetical protein